MSGLQIEKAPPVLSGTDLAVVPTPRPARRGTQIHETAKPLPSYATPWEKACIAAASSSRSIKAPPFSTHQALLRVHHNQKYNLFLLS